MLADQRPFRQMVKNSFEQWFVQQDLPPKQRTPLRAGRRRRTNHTVVDPLRGVLDDRPTGTPRTRPRVGVRHRRHRGANRRR